MSGFADTGRLQAQFHPSLRSSALVSTSSRLRGEGIACSTLHASRPDFGATRQRGSLQFPIAVQASRQSESTATSCQTLDRPQAPLPLRRTGWRGFAPCRSHAEGLSRSSPQSDPEPRRRQYSAPRTPLQRQRPGPQRPMDSRLEQPQHPPQQQRPQGSYMAQQRTPTGPQREAAVQRVQPQPSDALTWSSSTRQTTVVHFCLQYHTNYGQRIRLVGSHVNLGAPPSKCTQ